MALAQDSRDPIGETASYKLDKASARTSSLISDGEATAIVTGKFGAEPDEYNVDLNYKFKIQLIGTRTGTESVAVPAEYFSEQFLVELRENGTYESERFKVEHRGFADTTTINGDRYNDCDVLYIHDIDTSHMQGFRNLLKQIAIAELAAQGLPVNPKSGIEDLTIVAHIEYGIPVLGAVKLDIKGKYDGMNVKAGLDYIP